MTSFSTSASAKQRFFESMRNQGLALTYDDVRLKTGHSEITPAETNLETRFSRNVPLKIPLVSAAMDTVTESRLAIALAKLGGIGIIHKNLAPEAQAQEVARVKYHLNGRINSPICVYEDETIEQILNRRADKRYGFHSFPVLNRNGAIVGILTNNDFTFCDTPQAFARDIMTAEPVTAPAATDLDFAYDLMKKTKKKALPLLNPDGSVAGMYTFTDVMRIRTGSLSQYNVDNRGQLRVGAAIGVGDSALLRLETLLRKNVDVVVIDTAHGDSKAVLDTLREIKSRNYTVDVVAGNISEPSSATRLIDAGADGIKVGQGPGSICTTRIIAGIGCPQVTAVYEVSEVAAPHNVPVCADGGIRYSGDLPIAIGAGASSVMIGKILGQTTEAPGDIVFKDGRRWKMYRGMGSAAAMKSNQESRDRYNQSDKFVPEGVEGLVAYVGDLEHIVHQFIGGLRSGMGYLGAGTISELQEKADFHRITEAGKAESHPHDIVIINEPPNYSGK